VFGEFAEMQVRRQFGFESDWTETRCRNFERAHVVRRVGLRSGTLSGLANTGKYQVGRLAAAIIVRR
jgi:hypothetical protein